MKAIKGLLILLLLFISGATTALAQQEDRDGDGVPDTRDNCPSVAGVAANNGCPTNTLVQPPPPSDTDGDGIPDSQDPCPTVPGSIGTNGCPPGGNPNNPDTDGDGIPDANDQCPTVAGVAANNGCPPAGNPNNPDTDGDGIPDPNDQCPTVAGVAANNGCPPAGNPNNPDTDGDGIPDPNDQCPMVAGVAANNGCPPNNNPTNPEPNNDGNGENPPPAVTPVPAEPTFRLPHLPADGCHVTSGGDYRTNVRQEAKADAEIIGWLLPGTVYPALGLLESEGEIWVVLDTYQDSVGNLGYTAGSVVRTANCSTTALAHDDVVVDGRIITGENFDSASLELCTIVTGYDAAYWSASDLDSAVQAYYYGTFIFAAAPGEPIPVGTQPFAVLNLINNPADASYDPANWTVQATDPAATGSYGPPMPFGRLVNAQFQPAVVFVGGWGSSMYQYAYNDPAASAGTPHVKVFDGNNATGGANFVLADGSVRFISSTGVYDPFEVSLYRLGGELGGTCGAIGTAAADDFAAPTGEDDGVAEIFIPINRFACTIINLFDTVYAFNYPPGASIPDGTHPLAIIGNPDPDRPDANIWAATLYQINDNEPFAEYLQYGTQATETAWMAAPRVGGTCGPIVSGDLALTTPDTPPVQPRAAYMKLGDIKGNVQSSSNVLDSWGNVMDQLCGGEYVVWGETDSEGNPINLEGECLPNTAPIQLPTGQRLIFGEDGIEPENPSDLVFSQPTSADGLPLEEVSFNYGKIVWTYSEAAGTTLDLRAVVVRDGFPQTREDGTTVFEYCFDASAESPCHVIEIEPTCAVTPLEANLYQVACESEDMFTTYPLGDDGEVQTAAARMKCSNNLKQIGLAIH